MGGGGSASASYAVLKPMSTKLIVHSCKGNCSPLHLHDIAMKEKSKLLWQKKHL